MPNRSIGRYLAALATAFLASQLVQYAFRIKPHSDGRTRKIFIPPDQPISTSEAARENHHPTEAEHRSAEQVYWRKSIRATWIAVAIATVAAVFSYQAFQEARRQADAAEEGNRPWVSVSGLKINYIIVTESAFEVSGQVEFANVGHSPAEEIEEGVSIAPVYEFVGESRAKDFCEQEKVRRFRYLRGSLDIAFPGLPQTREAFGARKIEDFINDDRKASKDVWKSFDLNKAGINFMPEIGKNKQDYAFYQFSVIGCITYRFSKGAEFHGTSFAYNVARARSADKYGAFYLGKPVRIDRSGLAWDRSVYNAYAD